MNKIIADTIIQGMSTLSILALGVMIGQSENLWTMIPMFGVIIFYGLHMANQGAKKEKLRNQHN